MATSVFPLGAAVAGLNFFFLLSGFSRKDFAQSGRNSKLCKPGVSVCLSVYAIIVPDINGA